MAGSRRIRIEILYDGEEVGLSKRAETVSYTDNASEQSDEITVTLDDRDADWYNGAFTPEKGHELDVTVYFLNWEKEGDLKTYHCGCFTVDDISYSGPPDLCQIKGISVPADEGFQSVPVNKVWQNIRLSQIAGELKEKYGMGDLMFWGGDPLIEEIAQEKKTDSSFLSELCKKYGKCLKVYKKAIVIFDKESYEARGNTKIYQRSGWVNYSWNSTLVGTYTGARLTYTDTNRKEPEAIDVMVGDGPRILHLDDSVKDEAEAIKVAKEKVNSENEKAVTLRFKAMGDPDIVASCNIQVVNSGRMNGKYFVKTVSHKFSGNGGHSMDVSGYRIFRRL